MRLDPLQPLPTAEGFLRPEGVIGNATRVRVCENKIKIVCLVLLVASIVVHSKATPASFRNEPPFVEIQKKTFYSIL